MSDSRDTIDRSSRHHQAETFRQTVHLPGQTNGHPGAGIHFAYCKTNAGTGNTIQAYLDVDATGLEITVTCTIAKGSNLNLAFPRLTDGLEIPVLQKGSQWKCLWGFSAAAEDC